VLGDSRPGAINLLLGRPTPPQQHAGGRFLAQVGLNRIYKESHQSIDLVSMFSQ